MFVGHAMVAFSLVGSAAALRGVEADRALVLGAVAAAFATVPDVDIVYALAGVVRVWPLGLWPTVEAFWSTGNVVHRAVSHSVLLGVPACVGFALAPTDRGWPVAVAVLGSLAAWVLLVGGVLAGLVATLAFAAGTAVALLAASELEVGPRALLATAAAGWLTHPFGDLFTGEPPQMLYPLDATLVGSRLTLHPDPTLHLLAAFGIELATIWLATLVYLRLRGDRLALKLDRRAGLAAGYGGAVVVLPAPTLEVSYHFVFSVLAVGALGLLAGRRPRGQRADRLQAVVTGLAAVTVAAGAYALAYIVL